MKLSRASVRATRSRHSPRGECGLKCQKDEWINRLLGHSPRGECGLKLLLVAHRVVAGVGHSPRGE